MRGEGFDAAQIDLMLTVADGSGRRVMQAHSDELRHLEPPRDVPLLFELQATCAVPKPGLPHEQPRSAEPTPRVLRYVWLETGRHELPVYDREALAGSDLRGPALVDAADTTFLIPDGCVCRFHPSGSAVIEEG